MQQGSSEQTVYLVDDDNAVLKSLSRAIRQYDLQVEEYSSALTFLEHYNGEPGCLVLDLSLPQMDGLELQAELAKRNYHLPIVFISGHGGITESVKALRRGALNFLEKPFRTCQLIESINEALTQDSNNRSQLNEENDRRARIASLTDRERDIFDLLMGADEPPSSKVIAQELKISHRTVEHHRSRILEKLCVKTVIELRLELSALVVD